jgi:hypothetical protein
MITLGPAIAAVIVSIGVHIARKAVAVPLLALAIALPVAAEIAALAALDNGRAGSLTAIITWLGLGTGLVILVLPLAWAIAVVGGREGRIAHFGWVLLGREARPPREDKESENRT